MTLAPLHKTIVVGVNEKGYRIGSDHHNHNPRISDVVVDAGNDLESYELGLSVNFAYPWAYISVGNTLTFNDYKKKDTSINSNILRSDAVNTVDLSLSKAVGDFLPLIDPKKNLVMNISYEKVFSESNIINYDYIDDAISLGISKSISLDKKQ